MGMSEEELLVNCLPDAPFKEKLIEVLGKKIKRITELEQQLKAAKADGVCEFSEALIKVIPKNSVNIRIQAKLYANNLEGK